MQAQSGKRMATS